jgi:hypothetical protein
MVEGTGKFSEALEYMHRVRGALDALHQLIDTADLLFEEAAAALRANRQQQLARTVETDVVSHNVLPGRWTSTSSKNLTTPTMHLLLPWTHLPATRSWRDVDMCMKTS